MTKLNQILAIEGGVKNRNKKTIDNVYHTIQKSALFQGIAKRYEHFDSEDVTGQLPPETKNVQATAASLLQAATDSWRELINVTATKDHTNTLAKADIMVDGQVIYPLLAAPTILWLEKQLVDLHSVLEKIPLLDPGETWTYEPNAGAYRTPEKISFRNKKVLKNHVKYEATKEHPAQVDTYSEDIAVGRYYTVNFSGALPADKQRELLTKLEKLQDAVRKAREEANMHEVTDKDVGDKLMEWLTR